SAVQYNTLIRIIHKFESRKTIICSYVGARSARCHALANYVSVERGSPCALPHCNIRGQHRGSLGCGGIVRKDHARDDERCPLWSVGRGESRKGSVPCY